MALPGNFPFADFHQGESEEVLALPFCHIKAIRIVSFQAIGKCLVTCGSFHKDGIARCLQLIGKSRVIMKLCAYCLEKNYRPISIPYQTVKWLDIAAILLDRFRVISGHNQLHVLSIAEYLSFTIHQILFNRREAVFTDHEI